MALHELEVVPPVVALEEVGGAWLVLQHPLVAAPHVGGESWLHMFLIIGPVITQHKVLAKPGQELHGLATLVLQHSGHKIKNARNILIRKVNEHSQVTDVCSVFIISVIEQLHPLLHIVYDRKHTGA